MHSENGIPAAGQFAEVLAISLGRVMERTALPVIRPVVLCVDDAEEMLGFYQSLLGNYGYSVMVAEDGAEALELFQSGTQPIDAVILDYHMPAMTGLQLAVSLKSLAPELPIMMVAGNSPRLEEMSPFVDAAIPKGVSIREIADQLELLLEERSARIS